jgi:O-antigen/teichoic acid export membrane protein
VDIEPLIEPPDFGAPLQEVARSGFAVAGLRVAAYAVGFIASVLITRALGPTGRGLFALPVAILGIVMALSHIGIEHANVYLAGQRVPLPQLWANATVASILLAVAGWIVLGLVYLAGGQELFRVPPTWLLVTVAQVPFLLQAAYWTNILQLDGGVVPAVRATLVGAAIHALSCVVLFVIGTLTPFRVLLLMWTANGSAWAVLLGLGVRRHLTGEKPNWMLIRRTISFGAKAAIGLLFFFLLLRVDQLMVRHILGVRALGLYSLAVTLAEFLWLLSDPFALSLLPFQVRSEGNDDRLLGYATARMTLAFSVTISILAWVVAPYAIRLAYGQAFAGSVWPFRLLLPGMVLLAAQRPLNAVLLKEGRPWLITGLALAALAVNVGANLLLLPSVGIAGASMASSVCYGLLAVAYVVVTSKRGVVGVRDLRPRMNDLRQLRGGLSRRTR